MRRPAGQNFPERDRQRLAAPRGAQRSEAAARNGRDEVLRARLAGLSVLPCWMTGTCHHRATTSNGRGLGPSSPPNRTACRLRRQFGRSRNVGGDTSNPSEQREWRPALWPGESRLLTGYAGAFPSVAILTAKELPPWQAPCSRDLVYGTGCGDQTVPFWVAISRFPKHAFSVGSANSG